MTRLNSKESYEKVWMIHSIAFFAFLTGLALIPALIVMTIFTDDKTLQIEYIDNVKEFYLYHALYLSGNEVSCVDVKINRILILDACIFKSYKKRKEL